MGWEAGDGLGLGGGRQLNYPQLPPTTTGCHQRSTSRFWYRPHPHPSSLSVPFFAGSLWRPLSNWGLICAIFLLFLWSLWSPLSSCSGTDREQGWGAPQIQGCWIGWLRSDGVDCMYATDCGRTERIHMGSQQRCLSPVWDNQDAFLTTIYKISGQYGEMMKNRIFGVDFNFVSHMIFCHYEGHIIFKVLLQI